MKCTNTKHSPNSNVTFDRQRCHASCYEAYLDTYGLCILHDQCYRALLRSLSITYWLLLLTQHAAPSSMPLSIETFLWRFTCERPSHEYRVLKVLFTLSKDGEILASEQRQANCVLQCSRRRDISLLYREGAPSIHMQPTRGEENCEFTQTLQRCC